MLQGDRLTLFPARPSMFGIAWLAFAFTCFQLTFLVPYVELFPGNNANVFSGLLCGLALVFALLASKYRRTPWKWSEVLVCLGLLGWAAVSAACSLESFSAALRVFVLFASGLGGFWCARILLCDSSGQDRFQWLCLVLLIGASIYGLIGFFWLGRPSYIFDNHEHAVNEILLVLCIGPLGMIARGGRFHVGLGSLVLVVSYAVICLNGKMSGVWIPLMAGGIGAALTVRGGRIVALGIALVGIAVCLSIFYLPGKYGASSPNVWFRAENYPFSVHIAKKHPIFGIGLWAKRDQFLVDYEMQYPGVTKEQFSEILVTNRTPENIFLDFVVDLGIPFAAAYVVVLACLLWTLFKSMREKPPETFMNPVVILVPIMAIIFYCQGTDGLLYPQVNWFFHIFLGMIPTTQVRASWTVRANHREGSAATKLEGCITTDERKPVNQDFLQTGVSAIRERLGGRRSSGTVYSRFRGVIGSA